MEQRLEGEFEVHSVQQDESLKLLVTVSRVGHSMVSLHRVEL